MALKVCIHVNSDGGEPQRVCWYVGTSDLMVENAIRMKMRLPRTSRFLLRDSDGDLVPVSSTLPPDQTYQLVVVDDPPADGGSSATYDMDRSARQPRRKRPRRLMQAVTSGVATATISVSDDNHQVASTALQPSLNQLDGSALNASVGATRPRSIVYLVTLFLETFTRAIPSDDNVNFIPNTGPYALYTLYCHLFQDTAYHPKNQNSFYKMTSTQGKVDRQRVIRYFQCPASRIAGDQETQASSEQTHLTGETQELQYVTFKPEGKGPLLRKYVQVEIDVSMFDLTRTASFIRVLDLDPQAVVSEYIRFLDGFAPISKAYFQTHTRAQDHER